jgi:coenzyme F420-reducing hydrogenase delta subunit/ferredoxin
VTARAPELCTKPPTVRRALPVINSDPNTGQPPVRGEKLLRAGDSAFQRLDAWIDRAIVQGLNPLAQAGAIANTTFIIACISGVALLFWYKTSVHQAYASVQGMSDSPWTAGLIRSIHRYSSDACMLFVVIHALKSFFARRFGGVRWLAWVTGIFSLATLGFVGWIGYWLVWDERAQLVALGTARLLDELPIFADPLSRSFLADATVNSLLFFVVFFLHMLIPLAMAIALWLHITRLSRPQFLTGRAMTLWVLGSLLLLSLLAPADLAAVAHMATVPERFTIDGWYLLPMMLTERLQAGGLWALTLGSGVLLYSIPWALARGRARIAEVITSRCNACERCYHDCPYDAIRMVARTDGRPLSAQAEISPEKCLGCGICAGSCDSTAIGLPWLDAASQRQNLDRQVEALARSSAGSMLALVCAESAGSKLEVDKARGTATVLPGYSIMRVPCAGWIHPLLVERALRHGATGVLIVACGPSACAYREGGKWTALRLAGLREPKLRAHKVDPARVRVVELSRPELTKLSEEAAAFRVEVSNHSADPGSTRPQRRVVPGWRRGACGGALAAGLLLGVWGATRVVYGVPGDRRPELVVSFKHPGASAASCRDLTEQEKRQLSPHMRPKQICDRRRASVRLRVFVDGHRVLSQAYEPGGIWSDGNSIAIERLEVPEGAHLVRVEIGDSPDPGRYQHVTQQETAFRAGRRVTVLFDKLAGFQWHG